MSHRVIAGARTVGTLIAQKLTEQEISCVLVSRTPRESTRREIDCRPTAWTEVIGTTAQWYRTTYDS